MEIKNIKGNTFCIDTKMACIPFYKINYREIIMMDSGWPRGGEREGIAEVLKTNNLKVAAIICTHAHMDHIGNAEYLKEKYNCIIAMPECEAVTCSSIINLKFYHNNYNMAEIAKHFGQMVCKTDIMITPDQENIYVCGVKFKIIHTPGHSAAHICVITPDDVAYLGDALVGYELMEQAKMPYSYSLTDDLKSKEKLYDLKCSKYIVAHKDIYDDITKLIKDNIKFYKDTANSIYDVMDRNRSMTMEEIFRSVTKDFNINLDNRVKYGLTETILVSYVRYLNEKGMLDLNMENGLYKYLKKAPICTNVY
ncbi:MULTISPECIES: MBL fold metallo-hydrolase [Clostridium]|uniref:Hydroxyacylglutathione hydrolase n=1 Tax=Clostridium ragsdalei P11 TaxID=1353534 RepID=A0A1A6B0U5_9CLOT|nr:MULTISPECIES: MBL fold metallo-hydrolase [Clostridium]OBR95905.1 hydroxyacylglutathione hydrolase [Clostridium ragsdalei P11]QXE19810.1 hydrolase [Clostridium sp. 001]